MRRAASPTPCAMPSAPAARSSSPAAGPPADSASSLRRSGGISGRSSATKGLADTRGWEDRAFSVMAGGDFALIKSVEGFEDFTQFGGKQIGDLGVGPGRRRLRDHRGRRDIVRDRDRVEGPRKPARRSTSSTTTPMTSSASTSSAAARSSRSRVSRRSTSPPARCRSPAPRECRRRRSSSA